jgi:uncharacterized protein
MKTSLDTLELEANGARLAATVLSPTRRLPGVLFVHGWNGSQRHDLIRAREVAGLGCVCLTFDLRGHEGTASEYETVDRGQNLHDLLVAYDTLAQRPDVDASSIAVVGISYGGYLAALLTARRRVRWLALRSAALYPDEGWELPKRALHARFDLRDYRARRIAPEDNHALEACAQFQGDALVVAAGRDEIVPRPVTVSYVTAFARGAQSVTLRTIAEADHALSDRGCQQVYTRHLVAWLTEMIVGARQEQAEARVAEHVDDDDARR